MNQSGRKANRLINETSPYLLQHAYNPVDWYPWCEEAFAFAKEQDRPVILSIGYSTCHWCHVMERESFENNDVASFMNEHFVCIKLDREERPDLDHIYMDAVQAMTGQGGWPLNVFLTPDRKPFYGGTYFPPVSYAGRPSWMEVLRHILKLYISKKSIIREQTEKLLQHLNQMNQLKGTGSFLDLDDDYFHRTYNIIKQHFDRENGGYGSAPKFPSTYTTQFLLLYHHTYDSKDALDHALLTIKAMLRGGIYDQIRGGLCRYATDDGWLVPHFEKMLYDNANFIKVLCELYKHTGDSEILSGIKQTTDFILSEFQSSNGMFYAAFDADSEGIEGKYYCWTAEELKQLLGDDYNWFADYYQITETGNWEHTNILCRKQSPDQFALSINLKQEEFLSKLQEVHSKLITTAQHRIKPGLDYKHIVSWNAMMIDALVQVSSILDDEKVMNRSRLAYDRLISSVFNDDRLFHQVSKDKIQHDALLDDYAFLIRASISLYAHTGMAGYLQQAQKLTNLTIANFWNRDQGVFQYAHMNKQDVLIDKLEIFDNVIASGNSVMLDNLIVLNRVDQNRTMQDYIDQLISKSVALCGRYPTSFSNWLCIFLRLFKHKGEIVLTGTQAIALINVLSKRVSPEYLILPLTDENTPGSLFKSRLDRQKDFLYYLCHQNTCSLPSSDWEGVLYKLRN